MTEPTFIYQCNVYRSQEKLNEFPNKLQTSKLRFITTLCTCPMRTNMKLSNYYNDHNTCYYEFISFFSKTNWFECW